MAVVGKRKRGNNATKGKARKRVDCKQQQQPKQKGGVKIDVPALLDSLKHEGRLLGEGGYGKVYEYKLGAYGKVAIKVIRRQSDEKDQELLREVQMLSALGKNRQCSQYVVHLMAHYITAEYMVIVMKLVEGQSLYDYMQMSGAWVYGMTAEWRRTAAKLMHAVYCLHRAGVVHADVKDDNVMRLSNGSLVLIDFGLACKVGGAAAAGALACKADVNAGAYAFMSPERIDAFNYGPHVPKSAAERNVMYKANDYWAIGIIMYRGATRRDPPFLRSKSGRSKQPRELGKAIHTALAMPTEKLLAEIEHPEQYRILETLFTRDPRERLRLCEAMARRS
jgi:serine/threonine protein kinase